MGRAAKAMAAAGLLGTGAATVTLVFFLIRQGLERATMWAGVLVLFLTIVIAITGIWAIWIAVATSKRSDTQSPDSAAGGSKQPAKQSHNRAVFNVHARRDAYTAQQMTVNQHPSNGPEQGSRRDQ